MDDRISILLVDDEEEFVSTMAERLEIRDFPCFVANSGVLGLELLRSENPSVMVVDMRMPGMGGLEVLDRVKASGAPVPVIVLSGHANPTEEDEAKRRGAFAYLRKPLNLEALLETVHAAVNRSL